MTTTLLPRLTRVPLLLALALPGTTSARADEAPQKPAYDAPPIHVDAVPIHYPFGLVSDNKGRVEALLRIGADGVLNEIVVLESPHPVFESAALDRWLSGSYRPAYKDGQPIAAKLRTGIKFIKPQWVDAFSGVPLRQGTERDPQGVTPFKVPERAAPGLPEDYRYDTPPALTLATGAVYPLGLLQRRVTGSAQVAFVVDADGRVRQTRVLEATHPDFGHAAAAMLETWRFKPAKKNGQPSAALLHTTLEFSRANRDTAPGDEALDLLARLNGEGAPLATTEALDRLPTARVRPLPVAPRSGAPAETVLVEFVVDAAGRVQLPRVVGDATPARAWAALTAAKRWRFDPPRVDGQPTPAVLRLPFEFKAATP